jgi:hypothetical protein
VGVQAASGRPADLRPFRPLGQVTRLSVWFDLMWNGLFERSAARMAREHPGIDPIGALDRVFRRRWRPSRSARPRRGFKRGLAVSDDHVPVIVGPLLL